MSEPIPRNEKSILGEWDRSMLEKGVPLIIEKLYADFKNDFPDAIVLPDTAARPLFFLLKPIFEHLHALKGTTIPRRYAFNTRRLEVSQWIAELPQRGEQRGATVHTTEQLKQRLRDDGVTEEMIGLYAAGANPEAMKMARDFMAERAKEILHYEERKKSRGRIAVIDEYATETAKTSEEIRKAFGNSELKVYLVTAQNGADSSENTFAAVSIDPYDPAEANPDRDHRAMFSYVKTNAVGVYKPEFPRLSKRSRKIVATGSDKITLRADQKRLQTEMRELGKRISKQIELPQTP